MEKYYWLLPTVLDTDKDLLYVLPHSRAFSVNETGKAIVNSLKNGYSYQDILASVKNTYNLSIQNEQLYGFLDALKQAELIGPHPIKTGRFSIKHNSIEKNRCLRLFIETTYRCNLKCLHCYVNNANFCNTDELDTVDIMTIIKDFNSIGGAQIDYTGGEFFLRKDALELLEMSAACNMFSYIFTNATMLDESKVQKMRDLNSIRMICVSLDDCIAEYHDRFRGVPGAFKKTVAGIELLKEYNLPVCINLVINEYNHDRIGEIAKFFKTEYGLPSRVSPILPIGRGKNLCGQEIDDICRAMNA